MTIRPSQGLEPGATGHIVQGEYSYWKGRLKVQTSPGCFVQVPVTRWGSLYNFFSKMTASLTGKPIEENREYVKLHVSSDQKVPKVFVQKMHLLNILPSDCKETAATTDKTALQSIKKYSVIRIVVDSEKTEFSVDGKSYPVQAKGKGAYSTALISSVVLKVLRSEEKSTRIRELGRAKKVEEILTKVNPDGKTIGIMPKPISSLALRKVTLLTKNEQGTWIEATSKTPVQFERPFTSDCFHAVKNHKISNEEIPRIAGCLAQGSKTLIENGVYHLDTKLENVGLDSEGRAYHFDLGGCFYTAEKNWFKKEFTASKGCILYEDCSRIVRFLMDNPKPDDRDIKNFKQFLEKVHIFQLGLSFFALATENQAPYPCEGGFPLVPQNPEEVNALKARTEQKLNKSGVYTSEQVKLIMKMLDPASGRRPGIAEVAEAFPLPNSGESLPGERLS